MARFRENSQLLGCVNEESEFLNETVWKFVENIGKKIRVCCFFEQKDSDISSIISRFLPWLPSYKVLLVNKQSACLDIGDHFGLPMNHFEINKYPSSEDVNFKLVKWQIKDIMQTHGK